MFKKVLIANRGEIAIRILRACRELGLATVAVHSQADTEALHVRFADEAVCIGPPRSVDSYLHIPALIAAAEITGADAVHPGYGFLAENDSFAELCQRSGLTFIGPSAEVMRLMGDKVKARAQMVCSGVPLLPGSEAVDSEADAREAAERVGYPVIIKASAGGGGRGMKIVRQASDLIPSWHNARAEAGAAFANPEVYLERYVEEPRHIEVQIAADQHGEAIYLGERECSIQRRHQKLVEEAPSVALSPEARKKLGEASVAAVKAVGYQNVGTLEFLMDGSGECFFMEMNTRIQVEHTVTEMITGIDLLHAQLRIAAGEPLGVSQADVELNGHAIEVRINAEDPVSYAPCPGRITALHLPGGNGVRVDTAIYQGYFVPPYYDSMIAKLIVHAPTRTQAIARLKSALSEFVVEGIKTNVSLYQRIAESAEFSAGELSTAFLQRLDEQAAKRQLPSAEAPPLELRKAAQ